MARQSGRRQGANPTEAPKCLSQKSSGQAVHNIPPLAQIVLAHNGGEASHTHKSRTPNTMPRRGNQPPGPRLEGNRHGEGAPNRLSAGCVSYATSPARQAHHVDATHGFASNGMVAMRVEFAEVYQSSRRLVIAVTYENPPVRNPFSPGEMAASEELASPAEGRTGGESRPGAQESVLAPLVDENENETIART